MTFSCWILFDTRKARGEMWLGLYLVKQNVMIIHKFFQSRIASPLPDCDLS
jgi:hypothetical protein